MTRLPDWNPRLVRWLALAAPRPFVPGTHDCALFLAGAVAAMTGVDYAASYRGRYTSLRGGLRILRRDGFADHIALAAHHLPDISPAAARPGDGVVVETPDGPALGLHQGEAVWVLSPQRLALVPAARVIRAFGV